jgi:hypothetical protein
MQVIGTDEVMGKMVIAFAHRQLVCAEISDRWLGAVMGAGLSRTCRCRAGFLQGMKHTGVNVL